MNIFFEIIGVFTCSLIISAAAGGLVYCIVMYFKSKKDISHKVDTLSFRVSNLIDRVQKLEGDKKDVI